jgi:hypothetical protein
VSDERNFAVFMFLLIVLFLLSHYCSVGCWNFQFIFMWNCVKLAYCVMFILQIFLLLFGIMHIMLFDWFSLHVIGVHFYSLLVIIVWLCIHYCYSVVISWNTKLVYEVMERGN